MNVVCLEDEGFYSLVEKVVARISDKQWKSYDKWITGRKNLDKNLDKVSRLYFLWYSAGCNLDNTPAQP